MENNEITMCLYVKMDIHDKRNEAHKFKVWTKCQVKIEAIKCLPCFLRLTFMPIEGDAAHCPLDGLSLTQQQQCFTVSINVPGVSISLATSRTKQFSYGLFWTHNRRDCFIYFALDTDASCRKHMKWIKKSIKNLELYRQVFLEQRRSSRGIGSDNGLTKDASAEFSDAKATLNALGPLPKIPDNFDVNVSSWSRRVSRASAIYEEIFESSRVARRVSRASIASGIYEEMKPTPTINDNSCNVITEECDTEQPPPVPPLPPMRKRINTFGNEAGALGDIPRSNTNPESEMAKKKKYKVMLDNLFGGRSKRAESVSEAQASTVEDLIDEPKPLPIYTNDIVGSKRYRQQRKITELTQQANRNSFSSPDLSKINLLDTFDEECVADILQNSFDCSVELELSLRSLDESEIVHNQKAAVLMAHFKSAQMGSADSLNISEQIPNNFNFSACNTSTINLMGASGAVLQQAAHNKHKILIDELTGYCVMAPIVKKTLESVATSTESTSSGYSTGSYSSTTSTCTNSTEDAATVPLAPNPSATKVATNLPVTLPEPSEDMQLDLQQKPAEESAIYENMCGSNNNSLKANVNADTPTNSCSNFTEHLYENLLTIKAAQELESPALMAAMSTSTPTDSPQTCATIDNFHGTAEEEESYYQTPRKSIISVDDKIPSYYPNSCDSVKMRRRSQSPNNSGNSPVSCLSSGERSAGTNNNTLGLKHLVSMKLQRERKENLYISSPQQIIEQRQQGNAAPQQKPAKPPKTKKTAAHKVAENVYAVRHINKKSTRASAHNNNNNNNKVTNANGPGESPNDKLQAELLQLAMLQNIDFKFDDTKSLMASSQHETPPAILLQATTPTTPTSADYENCYQAAESATRLLHKYATLAKYGGKSAKAECGVQRAATHSSGTPRPASVTPQRSTTAHHHLQVSQATNVKQGEQQLTPLTTAMSQSSTTKLETPSGVGSELQGLKKFASLPRFKRIDFSPLKMRINNVLQRNQPHAQQQQQHQPQHDL